MEQKVNDDFTLETEKMSLFDKEGTDFQKKLSELRSRKTVYKSSFENTKIPMSLTFNDVLMVPQYSEVNSR
jgi:hypothetical protein